MSKMFRIGAFVLAILVVLTVAASLSVMVLEAGHTCSGDHCPICRQIAALTDTLRRTAPLLLIVMTLLGMIQIARYAAVRAAQTEYTTATPVGLKTKLSN